MTILRLKNEVQWIDIKIEKTAKDSHSDSKEINANLAAFRSFSRKFVRLREAKLFDK